MSLSKRQPLAKTVDALEPVIVIWLDAACDPGYDGPLDELRSGTVINHTIGFLAKRTRDELILVRDISPADNTVRWPYHIPRKLVIEIISLPRTLNSETSFPEGEGGMEMPHS